MQLTCDLKMFLTHCLTVSSLLPVALSSCRRVFTNQMGFVQVEAEKPEQKE